MIIDLKKINKYYNILQYKILYNYYYYEQLYNML